DPPRDGLKGQPHVRITCPEQHEPEIRDEQDGEDRQDEGNEASQGAGELVTLLRQIVQRLQRHMIGDAEPGQHHRDHGHRPGPAPLPAACCSRYPYSATHPGCARPGSVDGCRRRERLGRAEERGHYGSDRTGGLGTTMPDRSAASMARVLLEPPTRIELVTYSLRVNRSTD